MVDFILNGLLQNNKHVALANHKSFNGRSIGVKNNKKKKRNVNYRNPSSIGTPFPNVDCSHLLKILSTRFNEWNGLIEIHNNCNQALV
jgi:hypothetical protein